MKVSNAFYNSLQLSSMQVLSLPIKGCEEGAQKIPPLTDC